MHLIQIGWRVRGAALVLPGSGFRFLGANVFGGECGKQQSHCARFVGGRAILDDPDADPLNGIDGMIVQARLRRVACNRTMHWKQKGVTKPWKLFASRQAMATLKCTASRWPRSSSSSRQPRYGWAWMGKGCRRSSSQQGRSTNLKLKHKTRTMEKLPFQRLLWQLMNFTKCRLLCCMQML